MNTFSHNGRLYKSKPKEKLLWDYACADIEKMTCKIFQGKYTAIISIAAKQ